MTYVGELRRHARPMIAACLGMGFGLQLTLYTSGLFGPALLEEFGWTKSQYALAGTIGILTVAWFPVIGRLTDRFGVRRIAIVGVLGVSAICFAMSLMNGSFALFVFLSLLKTLFGTMSTTAVYTRLVAERFDVARGFALAVVTSGPPLVSAFAAPVVADIIADEGWRRAYVVLGSVVLAGSLAALLLAPPRKAPDRTRPPVGSFVHEFRKVAVRKVFWVLMAGMFMVNMPQNLLGAQMKLMALDSGATSNVAVLMLSAYALGVIAGRFACGMALDRFPPHLVAFCSLMLPAAGFMALWSSYDAGWFMIAAMGVVGMAQGSEGDVAAYMVSRHFDITNYSFVLGLVSSALTAGSTTGSLVLGLMLHGTEDYTSYVLLAAVVSLLGASTFLLVGRGKARIRTAGA